MVGFTLTKYRIIFTVLFVLSVAQPNPEEQNMASLAVALKGGRFLRQLKGLVRPLKGPYKAL